MNDVSNKDKNQTEESSRNQFNILLKISLIIGIIVISGFILYHILTPEPGFVTYGILNENQESGNYPTNTTVNNPIFFYITVDNYLERNFSFQIQIKKGDETTSKNPTYGSDGILNYTLGNFTLEDKQSWVSEQLNVSFSEVGDNQFIITELWEIKNTEIEYYDILWLTLNITS
ncbi:MAG: DUF1616 domain-containing protein [Promethearchaeota archaeon]|jgi:uncharacterized membrane protein